MTQSEHIALTPELLPCPFCGECLVYAPKNYMGTTATWVHPHNDCRLSDTYLFTDAQSVEKWNRRLGNGKPEISEGVAWRWHDDKLRLFDPDGDVWRYFDLAWVWQSYNAYGDSSGWHFAIGRNWQGKEPLPTEQEAKDVCEATLRKIMFTSPTKPEVSGSGEVAFTLHEMKDLVRDHFYPGPVAGSAERFATALNAAIAAKTILSPINTLTGLVTEASGASPARLIESAPDLLNELEVRLSDLAMLRKAVEAGDPRRELLVRIDDMARETGAAISKATGQNSSPKSERSEPATTEATNDI